MTHVGVPTGLARESLQASAGVNGLIFRVCTSTHVLVGGLVGGGQVGVEAGQPDDGPHREETHDRLQYGGNG